MICSVRVLMWREACSSYCAAPEEPDLERWMSSLLTTTHLENLGHIGAGSILGFLLRGCLSASDQVLRSFVAGAVAGDPVGYGRLAAQPDSNESVRENAVKVESFIFISLWLKTLWHRMLGQIRLAVLADNDSGYSCVAITCSFAPTDPP